MAITAKIRNFHKRILTLNTEEHIRYAIISFFSVLFIFLSHEFTHWLMGESLGYDMAMYINHTEPADGKYRSPEDYQLVALAGPLITIFLTLITTLYVRRTRDLRLFPLIFAGFYIILLSGIMNIFNPVDLGRVSRYLGVGLYTLPLIAAGIQFLLMDIAAKRSGITQKMVLVTVFWGVLFSSILILSDQILRLRLV